MDKKYELIESNIKGLYYVRIMQNAHLLLG